jgi:hypothetical protein
VASLANGSYYARVRGIDPAGIEGFDAVKLVRISNAPVSMLWPQEIAMGAAADYTPDGVLLKVYGRSVDLPKQLLAQVASDAAFTQALQTVAVNADATVLLRKLPVGQRSYVRFTATGAAPGTAASSPVFALDIPADWGTTVLGLAQALQVLQVLR